MPEPKICRPTTLGDAIVMLDNFAAAHADNPQQRRALTSAMAEAFFNTEGQRVRITD